MAETLPGPGTPPNIELTLAQQANEAMRQGADPAATTLRLHQMLTHLRANPDVAKSGNDALSQGADPGQIMGRVWDLTQKGNVPGTAADATAYNPTASGSIIPNLARGVRDLAVGAVKAPVNSFFNAVAAPGVGEARPNPNLSKGGNSAGAPIGGTYDAEHGAVTNTQRTQAGLQAAANVAAPSISRIPIVGVPLAGGTVGATYDPQHPVQGAALGATTALVLHGGGRLLSKTASSVIDATGARPASYAGTPTLSSLAARGAQRLFAPLLRDPSEGIGVDIGRDANAATAARLDALHSDLPEVYGQVRAPAPAGASATAAQPIGKTLLRSSAQALGIESAEQRSMGMIVDAMKADGLSLTDAIAQVSKQTGAKPETLMDLAGRNVLGLGRGASMVPGSVAKNEVPTRLFTRQAAQHERIMEDAQSLAGLPSENTRQTLEQTLANRNATANDAGASLRGRPAQQLDGLEQLAGRPSMQAAERQARTFAMEQGKSFPPIFSEPPATNAPITVTPQQMADALHATGGDHVAAAKLLAESGTNAPANVTARPLSFEEVSWLKKAMDTNSDAAKRRGQAMMGPSLEPTQSSDYLHGLMGRTTGSFLDMADRAFPDAGDGAGYAALRRDFGDETSNARALEWGKDLFKKNPDDAEVEFGKMGPAEQEMAKRGGLRAVQHYIEGKVDARDVSGGLSPTLMQRRLRLLFPDDNAFGQFGQMLQREAKMNQTKNLIGGQSNTADKLAELAEVSGFGLSDVRDVMMGRFGKVAAKAVGRASENGTQRLAVNTANALSSRLTGGATAESRSLPDVLNELNAFQNNRLLQAMKRGGAGSATTSAAVNTIARNDPFQR